MVYNVCLLKTYLPTNHHHHHQIIITITVNISISVNILLLIVIILFCYRLCLNLSACSAFFIHVDPSCYSSLPPAARISIGITISWWHLVALCTFFIMFLLLSSTSSTSPPVIIIIIMIKITFAVNKAAMQGQFLAFLATPLPNGSSHLIST